MWVNLSIERQINTNKWQMWHTKWAICKSLPKFPCSPGFLLNRHTYMAHRIVHCSLTQKWIHLKIPDSLFPLGVICHYLWSISCTMAGQYSSIQDYNYYKQMKLSIKGLQNLSPCRYALATAWLSFVQLINSHLQLHIPLFP